MQSSLGKLQELVVQFREARDWKQFHHPKDLSMVLTIEASEVMDLFRFKTNEEIREALPNIRRDLSHELADVLNLLLLLAHETGVDLDQALRDKLEILEDRYPVETARGRNLKYTELPDAPL